MTSVTRSSVAWNTSLRTNSARSLRITMLRLTEPRSDCDFVHGPGLHDRHQILGHTCRSVLLSRKMFAGSAEFLANSPRIVAQIFNLLYRRLAVGRASAFADRGGLQIRDTADCKSALLRFRLRWSVFHQGCE